jgi:hypothetical protein
MKKWLAILFFVGFQCLAQNKSSDAAQTMPSKEEFSELLSKADQQVSAFERTVKTVTPSSDGPISDLATKGLEAASAAHTIISAQQRNGPTGYGLWFWCRLTETKLRRVVVQIQTCPASFWRCRRPGALATTSQSSLCMLLSAI